MTEKTYKSCRQQLNILRSRGMNIGKGSQGSRVMRILESENYYNIINGYKELFLDSTATAASEEAYKAGTSFDEVYALYNFDRDVRNTYLKYLLKVENTFKTVIAHEFSAQYGHDNYLKMENFDMSSERHISSAIKLIGDIQQEIARQMSKHHQVVTHYMTEHGYIPLWVLVNVLTFGKIEHFYKNMKPADKATVSRRFCLQPDELSKFMHMLALARNKCAHDERIYNIRFKERIHTKSIKNFSALGIVRAKDGSYTYGTNDAYAVAIMFALLLSRSDLNEFISAMKSSFKKLQKQLHTISADDVMSIMGYGPNWTNLQKLV
ncbi:MAG: Abi family protein [Bacteroidales bacterium]|nr:Abi family protein [Bacteroidales bacterium]MCM1414841.1 Abi family protein [bacterium]MCM1422472.1 Abi family protein [bacterium]